MTAAASAGVVSQRVLVQPVVQQARNRSHVLAIRGAGTVADGRYPSYLGIPATYPSPDDAMISRQKADRPDFLKPSPSSNNGTGSSNGGNTNARGFFSQYKYGYAAYLGLVATGFSAAIAVPGFFFLKWADEHMQVRVAIEDTVDEQSGGARRQRHSYTVSTTIGVVCTALFAAKVMIPSVRPALVRFGYLNLPVFSQRACASTLSPRLSVLLSHFSHRTLTSFLASTLALVWLARETEYLISPAALMPVLGTGMVFATTTTAVLPRVLARMANGSSGGSLMVLRPICGASGLACAVLGFLATFEDAGDVPRYLCYAVGGATAVRAVVKATALPTGARACCLAAWEMGGLLGGVSVGKVPDLVAAARVGDMAGMPSDKEEFRLAFWGVRTTE
ncbi:uncharacterized protein V1518DRAFT_369759 [Limtongia smithiae]|uniref:uncharacterized protein n=1 Tax=Limtongia smithiae TaxID=1125753 RepID=UPI0034CFB827